MEFHRVGEYLSKLCCRRRLQHRLVRALSSVRLCKYQTKIIMPHFLCQPNQVQSQPIFFIAIVHTSIMFCLDVLSMSNTCAIVFVLYHMCAYLFTFSIRRYMYVFKQNSSLLYIPVYLQMLRILHVISIVSCWFNTFFFAFGIDV